MKIIITNELKAKARELAKKRAESTTSDFNYFRSEDQFYTGFIGEVIFAKLLEKLGKRFIYKEVFDRLDDGDIIVFMPERTVIDVKTASKPKHKYLGMPRDQGSYHLGKGYTYVGIRLNGDVAEIFGWCVDADLYDLPDYMDVPSVGCKLTELKPISDLINKMLPI